MPPRIVALTRVLVVSMLFCSLCVPGTAEMASAQARCVELPGPYRQC